MAVMDFTNKLDFKAGGSKLQAIVLLSEGVYIPGDMNRE